MRLVLHIGLPKTGTSSIQTILAANRALLARRGILYPDADGSNAHNLLPALFRDPAQHWAYHREIYGTNPEAIRSAAQRAWDRVRIAVDRAEGDTVVLSAEGFAFLDDPGALKSFLAETLPGAVPEVVVYLRHPVDWVQSNLFQRLLATTDVVTPMVDDWAGLLARWGEVGPLTIRSMDRAELAGGDVVRDFAEVLGVPADDLALQGTRRNASLSAEGTIIVHDFRRIVQPQMDGARTEEVRALIAELARLEEHPGIAEQLTKIRLRPEWRERVVGDFRDDLEKIRSEHGFRFSDDTLYAGDDPADPGGSGAFESLREVIAFDQPALDLLQAHLTEAILPAHIRRAHRGASHALPPPLRRLFWSGLRKARLIRGAVTRRR